MLVLARRLNQSIIIGNDIEVVIVDIKGDQVKIGIKAPKEIQAENIKAMNVQIKPADLGKLSDILKKKPQ